MKETQERLDNSGEPVTQDTMEIPGVSEDSMDVSETVDTSDISGIQEPIKQCTLHLSVMQSTPSCMHVHNQQWMKDRAQFSML